MHCTSCGVAVPVNAAFCPGCGRPALKPHETPTIMEPARISPMAAAAPRPAGGDTMRIWWLSFGIVLFLSLFIPISFANGITMFWDLFDGFQNSVAVGLIVTALLGLTAFIITLIFSMGIPRGATIAGCGLAGFIVFMAMSGGGPAILISFALIGVSMTLAGCLLRQHNVGSLTARLVGGISGGVAIVFSLITIIKTLTSLGNTDWTGTVAAVLFSLIFVLPIVAGVLALVMIGNVHNVRGLLKGCRILISIFIVSGIVWLFLMPMLGFFQNGEVEAILALAVRFLLIGVTMAIYIIMLGVGSTEVFKKIVPPAAA